MGNKGSTFCIDQDNSFTKNKLSHSDSYLSYGVCHMKGWRQFMEDSSIHLNNFTADNHYLFGIFDGHGGPQVAQFVQRHFSIQLYLNPKFKSQQYPQAMVETFNKMDFIMQSEPGKKQIDTIIRHNITTSNRDDIISDDFAGCTANVCFITEEQIVVANAGDSRCVAYNGGRVIPLSYDHKPEDKAQRKRIKEAGGTVSRGRVNHALNISRSLGDLQFKKNKSLKAHQQMVTSTPDVVKCKRKGTQFIIMGCDGIWQRKSNEIMTEWIKSRLDKGIAPTDILHQLFDEEVASSEDDYNGTDNMSAILIVFKQ